MNLHAQSGLPMAERTGLRNSTSDCPTGEQLRADMPLDIECRAQKVGAA
jgi:hypothetical protein